MTRYTAAGPEADRVVEEHLRVICDDVLANVEDVEAVVLLGGFARGEGTVKRSGKTFEPMNDYDIHVVSRKKMSYEAVADLCRLSTRKIFPTSRYEPGKGHATLEPCVDYKNVTLAELPTLLPLLKNYELAVNAVVLWGKGPKELLPRFGPEDLPRGEAFRVLLNRACALASCADENLFHRALTAREHETLVYYALKQVLACAEALSLSIHSYKASYRELGDFFSKGYRQRFPDLAAAWPSFPALLSKCTALKLNGDFQGVDAPALWLQARDAMQRTLRYLAEREFHVVADSNARFIRAFFQAASRKLFPPYYSLALQKRFGFPAFLAKALAPMLNAPVQLYLNYRFASMAGQLRCLSCGWLPYLSPQNPSLKLYAAALCLLEAVQADGIDASMVSEARHYLNMLCSQETHETGFESTRNRFNDLFWLHTNLQV